MSKPKNRKNTKPVKKSAAPPSGSKAAPVTKTMTVMAALKRPDGATGWQKHSVRGFLSTQKKKIPDFTLTKFTRGDSRTAYKLEVE